MTTTHITRFMGRSTFSRPCAMRTFACVLMMPVVDSERTRSWNTPMETSNLWPKTMRKAGGTLKYDTTMTMFVSERYASRNIEAFRDNGSNALMCLRIVG